MSFPENKSHMQACLEDHKISFWYSRDKEKTGEIFLTRIELNTGGYASNGKYFGIGAPLFSVDIIPEGESEVTLTVEMRGTAENGRASREALRAELQKLYPNMKVNR